MPGDTLALKALQVGETARIAGYDTSAGEAAVAYAARLTSLGLIPGTLLQVRRKAPLGDPIEVRVRGFSLAVRPAEAGCLLLETP